MLDCWHISETKKILLKQCLVTPTRYRIGPPDTPDLDRIDFFPSVDHRIVKTNEHTGDI